MIISEEILYCNISPFVRNQRLLSFNPLKTNSEFQGVYTLSDLPAAMVLKAEELNIKTLIIEGNSAFAKKIAKKINSLNPNLKVEVNPKHNEISY